MFVNPDNSAFQVALNSEIYVDKTGMLEYTNKVMNTLQGYICNSRPRRFGKSVTANMLAAYYSKGCDSREMFSTLKISESIGFKKNINKKNIIRFRSQNITYTIGVDDILYIMRNKDRKCIIKTDYTEYEVNKTLIELYNLLDNRFSYSHRACIVNEERISAHDKKNKIITFDNGEITTIVSSRFKLTR